MLSLTVSDISPSNFSLSQLLHSAQPFALLDDAQADAAQSRLYYGFRSSRMPEFTRLARFYSNAGSGVTGWVLWRGLVVV
jgi:hypothetical protein